MPDRDSYLGGRAGSDLGGAEHHTRAAAPGNFRAGWRAVVIGHCHAIHENVIFFLRRLRGDRWVVAMVDQEDRNRR